MSLNFYVDDCVLGVSIELQHQSLYGTGNVEGAVAHLQGVLLYGLLVIRLDGFLQILALVLDENVLAG